MTMHLACACDQGYLPHAAAMMHSAICANDPAHLQLHLLHAPELSAADRDRLRGMVESLGARIAFHAIDAAQVRGLPTMGRISQVMWYRVFLPQLLADQDRVLYLDCDTLVLDRLDALWAQDLGEAWIGAVANIFEPAQAQRPSQLGLGGEASYFNSGVLLMDLAAWRRQGLADRVLRLARSEARRLVWPDQDALNIVLSRRWLPLHPRWNCQNSFYFFPHAGQVLGTEPRREALAKPGILHFEGGALAKPWNDLCKHPRRRTYFEHRTETPWPQTEIEGRHWSNPLLRPLPMSLLIPALRWRERLARRLQRAAGAVS